MAILVAPKMTPSDRNGSGNSLKTRQKHQYWLGILYSGLKTAGVRPDQPFDRGNWCHHARGAERAIERENR